MGRAIAASLLVAGPILASTGAAEAHRGRDRNLPLLRSTPENVVWGGFPIDKPPVMTVKSGTTVRIDTLSGSGGTNPDVTPEEFFAQFGIKPHEILPDLKAFWESIPNRERYGGHILTGPLYVEGAEPGDTLEIEIIDIDTRVPYGFNSTGPTSGVMSTTYPGFRPGDPPLDIPATIPPEMPAGVWPDVRNHMYRTGMYKGKEVAYFADGVKVPLQPFMGVMATAPATGTFVGRTPTDPVPPHGVQISGPPGPYGGNMDNHELTEGSTLFLPVFQKGAQFFVGDAHSVQGDGEVSGTAIEHSLSGTFRFKLHKGKTITGPFAENDKYWITMGIDWDLDRATKLAVQQVIDFLVKEKGFTVPKAYSFASVAVDFQVSEVVDGTQVVSGMIRKDMFEDGKGHGRK